MTGYTGKWSALLVFLGNKAQVFDLDGSLLYGANVVKFGEQLDAMATDYATPHDLETGRVPGVNSPLYFAGKNDRNVFLPIALVERINAVIPNNPLLFIVNTGRSYQELQFILQQSGVEEEVIANHLVSVTSHGTELRFGDGDVVPLVKTLRPVDQRFLSALSNSESLKGELGEVAARFFGPNATFDVKRKTHGFEVGFRALLEPMHGSVDERVVEQTIAAVLEPYVKGHNREHPMQDERPKITMCFESMAVEIRQIVHKGHGMVGLVQRLLDMNAVKTGDRVLFLFDSALKDFGKGWRTDYPAACVTALQDYKDLGQFEFSLFEGIPTLWSLGLKGKNVYVWHPEGANFIGSKRPEAGRLSTAFPETHPLRIDATLASPLEAAQLLTWSLSPLGRVATWAIRCFYATFNKLGKL